MGPKRDSTKNKAKEDPLASPRQLKKARPASPVSLELLLTKINAFQSALDELKMKAAPPLLPPAVATAVAAEAAEAAGATARVADVKSDPTPAPVFAQGTTGSVATEAERLRVELEQLERVHKQKDDGLLATIERLEHEKKRVRRELDDVLDQLSASNRSIGKLQDERRELNHDKDVLAEASKSKSVQLANLREELEGTRAAQLEKKELERKLQTAQAELVKTRDQHTADAKLVESLRADLALEAKKVEARYRLYGFNRLSGLATFDDDADQVRSFITRELAKLVGQQQVKDTIWSMYNKLVIRRIKQRHLQGAADPHKAMEPSDKKDTTKADPESTDKKDAKAADTKADDKSSKLSAAPTDKKALDTDSDDEDRRKKNAAPAAAAPAVADFPGHILFLGPPGTGKTTTAHLIQKILHKLGMVNDRFTAVMGTDMIEKYVGWTAKKVNRLFDEAKGGVLFVDEVYSLLNSKDNFGKEALDTMLGHMLPADNDARPPCVVMLAGYQDKMEELIRLNAGMQRRVGERLVFTTYSDDELAQIFSLRLQAQQDSIVADPQSGEKDLDGTFANRVIKQAFGKIHSRARDLENAALAKRLYDNAERFRAARLAPKVDYVARDAAMSCQFVQRDLCEAADEINKYYAQLPVAGAADPMLA